MKIKRNKSGFYEEDKDDFKEWVLALVAVVLVFIGFSIHLITVLFWEETEKDAKECDFGLVSKNRRMGRKSDLRNSFGGKERGWQLGCHNQSKNPGIATIKKLCDGLEITITDFFNTDYFKTLEQEIK